MKVAADGLRGEVRCVGSDAAAYGAAAREILECGRRAIEARGVFSLVLSGGRTPVGVFEALVDQGQGFDWAPTALYWLDERCVPRGHPDSNYGLAQRHFLCRLPVAPRVFAMDGEDSDHARAARHYEDMLRETTGNGPPRFDVILLGLGEDGHVASLFPGKVRDDDPRLVIAVEAEAGRAPRLSLTLRAINAARLCLFVVVGAQKKDILQRIRTSDRVPAAQVAPTRGKLLWVVDCAAWAASVTG